MSKAILGIDAPVSCIDCPCYKGGNILRCGVNFQSLTDKEIREKPDCCPLRPMPEKKQLSGDVHNVQSMAEEISVASWNACIDAITTDQKIN